MKKIKPDGSKTIYVGGLYEVDKTSGGSVTRTVTYYPAGGAMRINIVGGSNTLYYILKDHLGSASVVTDASGLTVGEQRYYPYGETRFTSGTIYTDKLFTGQREITGLGIYDYGARFYSPKLGRFLSPDTIVPGAGNPQAWNRYSYVLGNPLRYSDPTGHMQYEDSYTSSNGTCKAGDNSCNWVGQSQNKPPKKDKEQRKPGEPLCKAASCDFIERGLTVGVFLLDGAGFYISSVEASLASLVYGGAAAACIASEFLACGSAFGFAFGVDVLLATTLAPVENGAGYFSTTLTVANDVLLGNFGYDTEVGVYVGTDSIVSARNSAVGSINESILDEAVSLSQWNYDAKRVNGEKPGGYTPLFSKNFLTQLLFKDWW